MTETVDRRQPPTAASGQVDLTPLVGTWLNSNSETKWIRSFVLAREGLSFNLHVIAADPPTDWGKAELTGYMDNIGELAFHARYDLGFMESDLAANTNKGLIVIAAFHKFKDDSGRTNFLCREFYYRDRA